MARGGVRATGLAIAAALAACRISTPSTPEERAPVTPTPSSRCGVATDGLLSAVGDEGLDEQGRSAPIAASQYLEPCDAEGHLLVVRVGAPWCGTCGWHIAHTTALLDAPALPAGAVRLLDVVLADDENGPPRDASLVSYRARIDGPGAVVKGSAELAARFRGDGSSRLRLPIYVVADTRTLNVVATLHDPAPDDLADALSEAYARLRGATSTRRARAALHDGHFTDMQWDMVRAITVPGAPPADATNAYADDPRAARLGARLFDDARLSPSGIVACRHCHARALGFSDGEAQASGVGKGTRNTPSITLASHARALFWDGRADTLWGQAMGPLESVTEMGSSRLFVAHVVADAYAADYVAIFGALPDLADRARFPASGKPGEAAFDAMAEGDRAAVTRVMVNVGKAVASFERTLRVKGNALDAYAAGDLAALTEAQKRGLEAFFAVGCAQCHYGPRLTDDAFHVLRFPSGRPDGQGDVGRFDGIAKLVASEFRSDGAYSDAPRGLRDYGALAPTPTMTGAFKTPALRGLERTAPYGHGGGLASVDALLDLYATAGLPPGDPRAAGVTEPWVAPLTASERADLAAILGVMTGEPVPAPPSLR